MASCSARSTRAPRAPIAPRAVQASARDFAQCAPHAGQQQTVMIPTVHHTLVEQPVVYKQYRQKVTWNQMAVPQQFEKITMPQRQNCAPQRQASACDLRSACGGGSTLASAASACGGGALRQPLSYTQTVAGADVPTYGCSKGPFNARSWVQDGSFTTGGLGDDPVPF